MSRTVSASSSRPYGVERTARVLEVPRSTVYARRKAAARTVPPGRRGPRSALTDDALVAAIRAALAETPWVGEGYRKVWAMLRHRGVRSSRGRVLRLMREHQLLAPHRTGNAHGPKAHDGTITTEVPDEMWGVDATQVVTTQEGTATVFVGVDHCSAECVSLRASHRGTRFEAIDALRQGVVERFGSHAEGVALGLTVRHDHGSPFIADLFQKELRFVGAASSPAFVREPEGNGIAERFIRTLKEQLLWIRRFATVAALQAALDDFRRRYNETWLIARHGYQSPAAVGRARRASRAA